MTQAVENSPQSVPGLHDTVYIVIAIWTWETMGHGGESVAIFIFIYLICDLRAT